MSLSRTALWKTMICSVVMVCIAALSAHAQTDARNSRGNRIPETIVGDQQQVILGHRSRQATVANDIGPVGPAMPMRRMMLSLKPTASQQADLDQLLKDIQDPSSPYYHKWLTPEQYGERFGQTSSDLQKITDWLTAQGFSIVETARGRNWIAFSGTAQQVQQTFNTQIHHYMANGVKHFANAQEPSVPVEIAGMVNAIHGLHDFKLHHNIRKPNMDKLKNKVHANLTFGDNFTVLAPDDVAMIYNINSLYISNLCGGPCNGTGQSIVVAGQSDVILSDINAFQTLFGLTITTPQIIFVPNGAGSDDPGLVPGDQDESSLDLEWAGATARGANIIFVTSNTSGAVFDSVIYAIDQDYAPVISLSYSACEPGLFPSDFATLEQEAQKANVEGITMLSASGDTGVAACDFSSGPANLFGAAVNYPASSPEFTGVGGTLLNDIFSNNAFIPPSTYWNTSNTSKLASVKFYIPEEGWNDTFYDLSVGYADLSSSGGGPSNCVGQDLNLNTCLSGFPKPSWQVGTGVPVDGVRDVPDVSLSASADNDPYVYCATDPTFGSVPCPTPANFASLETNRSFAGGTSFGTPVFAGIVAILNQYLTANHLAPVGGLGNINPTLYQMAQGANASNIYHDILANGPSNDFEPDNNNVICNTGSPQCGAVTLESYPYGELAGYNTGIGYDQVTGLGSVNAYNFVTSFVGTSAIVTPNIVPFSSLKGLATSASIVIYQNNTASTINLISVTVSPGDYTLTQDCTGSPIPPHGSCSANVIFNPTMVGSIPGTLTFTDAVNTNTKIVTLSGIGFDITIINNGPVRGHATTSSTIGGASQSNTFNLLLTQLGPSNVDTSSIPEVTFDCSNLPALTTCNVTPGSVKVDASTTNVTVDIITTGSKHAKRLRLHSSVDKNVTPSGNYMATLTLHIGTTDRTFYLPFAVD